jgi:hypothetical protein
MRFYRRPANERAVQITRVMEDAKEHFNHEATAKAYFEIYEKMLQRPLTSKGA